MNTPLQPTFVRNFCDFHSSFEWFGYISFNHKITKMKKKFPKNLNNFTIISLFFLNRSYVFDKGQS